MHDPNLQGTLHHIAQLGDPVLRLIAKPVPDTQAEDIRSMIDELFTIIRDVNGVGLAAPQISRPCRLFVMASRPNPRYPNAPYMEPTAVINPVIRSHSGETAKDWEGCLSIPGIRGLISRWKDISVSYTDGDGKITQRQFTDFIARIFQHEYDHLDGLLFTDRVESNRDLITEKEYFKLLGTKS